MSHRGRAAALALAMGALAVAASLLLQAGGRDSLVPAAPADRPVGPAILTEDLEPLVDAVPPSAGAGAAAPAERRSGAGPARRPRAVLQGRVVDAATGAPVRHFRLSTRVRGKAQDRGAATLERHSADGSFRVVAPAGVPLDVVVDGGEAGYGRAELRDVVLPRPRRTTVALEASHPPAPASNDVPRLVVDVRDDLGRPLPGAEVLFWVPGEQPHRATTGAEGQVAIDGAGGRRGALRARCAGHATWSDTVDAAGRPHVAVTLPRCSAE